MTELQSTTGIPVPKRKPAAPVATTNLAKVAVKNWYETELRKLQERQKQDLPPVTGVVPGLSPEQSAN